MEEWSKTLFETLDSFADRVDEFFMEINEVVEDWTEEWHHTVGVEIDKCLEDVFEPIIEIYFEFEDITGETDQLFTYPVEPTPEQNTACIGCHHYHGQVYGGNLLVCGMHPYGWDGENCPDWESN
ncbi:MULTISPECIES: hypothetical protein [unclassified Coleofasciculus]|uniref:hypothetical protein n=2 Tax=unclassified Coleofasciculus TaxID=2692782 RepID=UPI0018805E99|nr:hypothetical protein [Coleofasciculus sp. LEGE 07081]MBE9147999.1 hypothetical protein [Coleofasciculus sp. LEGE 07092]